jgi:hypothetical protein
MTRLHQQLLHVGLTLMTVATVGTAIPGTAANAATRTVPQSLRNTWFAWGKGDGGANRVKITAKTYTNTLGVYQHGKWRVNSEKHTLKLGKKLKKNKTFTLSKKADKNGYRTLTTLDQYNKYVMKVKRVKVHNKTKLKMITKFSDNSKRTDMFFPVTKKIINTYMD